MERSEIRGPTPHSASLHAGYRNLAPLREPAYFPRQDHLAKDHRVGPFGRGASHVAAGRIDPGLARLAAAVDEQREIGDRDLRVARAADHGERRSRLSERP